MGTLSSIAILGSARKESNTAVILQRLITGCACGIVDLRTCQVAPFDYEHNYPGQDQFQSIIHRIVQAPLTIIATPVYWYSYSTPMKVFIDRFSDLLSFQKELGRQLRGRRFALVSSSAELQPDKTLVEAFCRFCDYLGVVFVGCAHAQNAGDFVDPAVVAGIRDYLLTPGGSAGLIAPMRLSHVNVTMPKGCEDIARSFYAGLLALREIPKPEAVRSRGGVWFDAGGLDVHVSVEEHRNGEDANRHFGLQCADVDVLRTKLQAAGVGTEDGRPAPWRRFFVRDPFGNRIELHEPGGLRS